MSVLLIDELCNQSRCLHVRLDDYEQSICEAPGFLKVCCYAAHAINSLFSLSNFAEVALVFVIDNEGFGNCEVSSY
jgi:hypothetical protein